MIYLISGQLRLKNVSVQTSIKPLQQSVVLNLPNTYPYLLINSTNYTSSPAFAMSRLQAPSQILGKRESNEGLRIL